MTFIPLSAQDMECLEGHALLQAVYESLQVQLGQETDFLAVDRLQNTPKYAKVAWYVWWFIAEAGGSGIPGYLANHVTSAAEVKAFREALVTIEAHEVVTLLDSALAIEEVAECLPQDDQSSWYQQFKGNPAWPDWDSIEERSFALLSGPVSELAANYIRRQAYVSQ